MEGLTPGVTKLTLRDVATFMVTVSDNAATNVLIDRLGMDRVNALLDSLKLNQVRLQRKMMDVEAAKQGRENIGTPRQLAGLLEAIYRNKVVNAEQTKDLLRILSLPKSSQIPKLLPESASIANKPGSLDGVRNDSGIVMLRSRPFVISVMMGYLRDGRAGEAAISRIALEAYRHFEMLGAASPVGRVMSDLKN
jgi:beta-lactamase class A